MENYIRIRFRTSDKRPLEINDEEIEIPHEGKDKLVLRSKEPGKTILNSVELILEGTGYENKEEAFRYGTKYKNALSLAFAYLRLPADFGDRSPKYTISDLFLKEIAKASGYNTIIDKYGLSVYPTDKNIEVATPFPTVKVTTNKDRFLKVVFESLKLDLNFDESKQIAFELYSASNTSSYIDSKFLLLMMALENLIIVKPRSEKAINHVNYLIQLTKDSQDLSKSEKCSLFSSLKWFTCESISRSGRAIAKTLEPRKYMNLKATKFFNYCYDLRSKLVHGEIPRPDQLEIRNAISPLENFVADLICFPNLNIENN